MRDRPALPCPSFPVDLINLGLPSCGLPHSRRLKTLLGLHFLTRMSAHSSKPKQLGFKQQYKFTKAEDIQRRFREQNEDSLIEGGFDGRFIFNV